MSEIKRWHYDSPKPICGTESFSTLWTIEILEKRGYEAIALIEGDRVVVYYTNKRENVTQNEAAND